MVHIEYFIYADVPADGRFPTGGMIGVRGGQTRSAPEGGCGNEGCDCSPGHWITWSLPGRPDGTVLGYTVRFRSRARLLSADTKQITRRALQHIEAGGKMRKLSDANSRLPIDIRKFKRLLNEKKKAM
jgi:hypothetical protein